MPQSGSRRGPGGSLRWRFSGWVALWTLNGTTRPSVRETPSTPVGGRGEPLSGVHEPALWCAPRVSARPSRTSSDLSGSQTQRWRVWDSCFTRTSPTCTAAVSVRPYRRDYRQCHPQACLMGGPVRQPLMRRLRSLASRGAPPRSTSPLRSEDSLPERLTCAPSSQYLPDHPFFRELDPQALAILAGCAQNVASRRRVPFSGGAASDQFLSCAGPGGPADNTVRRRHEVVDTGWTRATFVGWSWLVPPYRWLFDARAAERTGLCPSTGGCLRDKCEHDPQLGYELMKMVTQVMFGRLTAARVRLLDLYAPRQATSPAVSPLLAQARLTDARSTEAGATHAAPG